MKLVFGMVKERFVWSPATATLQRHFELNSSESYSAVRSWTLHMVHLVLLSRTAIIHTETDAVYLASHTPHLTPCPVNPVSHGSYAIMLSLITTELGAAHWSCQKLSEAHVTMTPPVNTGSYCSVVWQNSRFSCVYVSSYQIHKVSRGSHWGHKAALNCYLRLDPS